MGTLFEQNPRENHWVTRGELEDEIISLKKIALNSSITLDQAIAIRTYLETERRNWLYTDNGDAWDEQIGGLGELFASAISHFEGMHQSLSTGLSQIANALDELKK